MLLVNNLLVEGKGNTRRRGRAGFSTLRWHRKEMMGPWSYVLIGILLASLVLLVLFLMGLVPLWIATTCIPAMLVTYFVWDKKTDHINDSWGEGARGRSRSGRSSRGCTNRASTSFTIGTRAGAT